MIEPVTSKFFSTALRPLWDLDCESLREDVADIHIDLQAAEVLAP
jgi:hypothetical protein